MNETTKTDAAAIAGSNKLAADSNDWYSLFAFHPEDSFIGGIGRDKEVDQWVEDYKIQYPNDIILKLPYNEPRNP